MARPILGKVMYDDTETKRAEWRTECDVHAAKLLQCASRKDEKKVTYAMTEWSVD